MNTLLMIDDDEQLVELVREYLTPHGFQVDAAHEGHDGLIALRATPPDVGILDEGFYTYFDDIDYCLNAARKGWSTWYVPDSRIVHLVGATTGMSKVEAAAPRPRRVPSYWFEARRRFFLKNHGPFRAMLVDLAYLSGILPGRIKRVVMGQGGIDPPHVISDFLRHSVFSRGFRVRDVANPALTNPAMTNPKRPGKDA